MFKINKNPKIMKELVLERYQATFITIDNKVHKGITYNLADPKAIRCSIPEFIMIDVKSDGYMEDEDKIMYILNNIISIEWNKVEEVRIPDNFDHDYKVYFTDNEVAKRKVKNERRN